MIDALWRFREAPKGIFDLGFPFMPGLLTKPLKAGILRPLFVHNSTGLRRQAKMPGAEDTLMKCAFIDNHKIDSYLKLRVLLSLHKQPQRSLSLDELCEQFFVADRRVLTQLMAELCQPGLLTCDGAGWKGSDQADIADCLACLVRTFDDPLARQRLLDQVMGRNAGVVN